MWPLEKGAPRVRPCFIGHRSLKALHVAQVWPRSLGRFACLFVLYTAQFLVEWCCVPALSGLFWVCQTFNQQINIGYTSSKHWWALPGELLPAVEMGVIGRNFGDLFTGTSLWSGKTLAYNLRSRSHNSIPHDLVTQTLSADFFILIFTDIFSWFPFCVSCGLSTYKRILFRPIFSQLSSKMPETGGRPRF